MVESIIVSAQAGEKLWAVMCLAYEDNNVDLAPSFILIDGIMSVLVAWAKDKKYDYPVYLHVTNMSRSKQKFMLATALHALREQGYEIRGL